MAKLAVQSYVHKNHRLEFIQHGENATFKVTTSKKQFLLRLHRPGYHTPNGLLEEIKVLKHLNRSSELVIPKPVKSFRGNYVESISIAQMGIHRNVTMN